MNSRAWILGIVGLWLALTGFLEFSHLGYLWNDLIVGVIVLVTGFGLARFKPWQGLIAGLLGIWVFLAAFIHGLQGGAAVLWNNLTVGLAIAVAGFTAIDRRHRIERDPTDVREAQPDQPGHSSRPNRES